ncbi:phage head closure protein [Acinetobacter sp. ME22]|uniref:phage head closure protein n=1 Tax=Acinetobacter sp. ME22 TaxID=2904802 RepID=UPI001EDB12FB|nr:phage head closure protein [Acinetobacter sp. ME22]MCG2574223.1 phage head closure protein [Acinetobacter sp. ME22]
MVQIANELRHRVKIQKRDASRDGDGFESVASWIDYKTIWAKISPLSAKDLLTAQAAQAQTIARMKVRYGSEIDTDMRVLWKDQIYAIDGPALDDAETGNIYSTFMLSSGVEKFKEG